MATATRPPADLLALAQLHRTRQQQLAAQAAREAGRLWRRVDASAPQRSWAILLPMMLRLMVAALREASRGSQEYVAAAMRTWGVEPDPDGTVAEAAFASSASDGRPLDTLLGFPAFEVQAFLDRGMPAPHAAAIGERHLVRIVATQVQDAARVATGVAQVNDRSVTGFVRVLTPPSCSRCVILAGRWYRYSHGFARHPQCDCVMMPAAEVMEPQSPQAIFDAMSDAELRAAGWGVVDIQAIRDGADIYQVTNARRELRSVSIAGQRLQATGVGASRHGLAGQRLGGAGKRQVLRLTPESIYAEASRLGWSRDELLRALKRYGYIL